MAVTTGTSKTKSDVEKLPKSVYLIVLTLMIDLLGFTVILPIMPSIFEFYGSNAKDDLYRNFQGKVQSFRNIVGAPEVFDKVLFGGLLGSMYSLLQFFASPILGALSDVYGRKPVLILSLMGIATSHIIWASAEFFYIFIIARFVGGIFRANVSLSTAIVTDLCSVKSRGKGMALIGIAFAIGFIVGPMIGAVFAAKSWDIGRPIYFMPAVFALFMTVLDILLVFLCFKDSLSPKARAKSIGSGIYNAFKFINPVSLFLFKPVQNISNKDLKCLQDSGIIYFLYLFLYSGLEFTLGFLTHIRFAFSSMQQGKMYLFSGIIMLLIQGGMVRRIPAGKELTVALSGAVVIIPSFIIIGLSNNLYTLYVGIALYAYASATVIPCLTTTVSKLGSVDQKGTVIGTFRSLGSLARGFGPFVSAMVYWSLGAAITYCLGGLLLIIPTLLLHKLKNNLQDSRIVSKTD